MLDGRTGGDISIPFKHAPIRTTDNKIDGVIIAFVDIHTLKNDFADAQEACEYAYYQTFQMISLNR